MKTKAIIIAAFATVSLAACGSTTHTNVEHVTTTVVSQASTTPVPSRTTTLIQQPPSTTTVVQAPSTVTSPSTLTNPSVSAGLAFRACDQNISASQDTSCPLAENVFYELWHQSAGSLANTYQSLDAFSPASHQSFTFTCGADSDTVTCASNTDSADVVMFPNAAVYDYTQAQANAYASSHTVS